MIIKDTLLTKKIAKLDDELRLSLLSSYEKGFIGAISEHSSPKHQIRALESFTFGFICAVDALFPDESVIEDADICRNG